MPTRRRVTEKNAYSYIKSALRELGWDVRNPDRDPRGQVYTDNQALGHAELRKGLGSQRPENIVKLSETRFWVIEAKSTRQQISQAVKEAEDYANDINALSAARAVIISGVAGNDDDGYVVRSKLLHEGAFASIVLNGEEVTGLLSPEVARRLIEEGTPDLVDVPIDESLFLTTAEAVNRDLHLGAINKNDRAKVMAALLLALVDDTLPNVDASPLVLIRDINTRAQQVLDRNEKGNFFSCVEIKPPPSPDNHMKFRRALVQTIQALTNLNIRSTMYSGTDLLGKFYEVFLKYGNGAKEIGIVLTPRHITRFAAHILDIGYRDVVYDPACGTGGFLIAALDYVRAQFTASAPQAERFKRYGLFGVDQDPVVTALAIVNMIFRNDGKNHILEGDCFVKHLRAETEDGHPTAAVTSQPAPRGSEGATKVLMNPPFALQQSDEKEYRFAQHALDQLAEGGLLFSVLPISAMFESGEVREWRRNRLLGENTLLSVVTFPPELFYPIGVHTLGIVVRKGIPHPPQQNVLWARAVHDGFIKVKGKRLLAPESRPERNDLENLIPLLRAFIHDPSFPVPNQPELTKACPVDFDDPLLELVPEAYLEGQPPPLLKSKSQQSNLSERPPHLRLDSPLFGEPMKSVSRLFELHVAKSHAYCTYAQGSVAFVSNGLANNGVLGYVEPQPEDKVFPFDGICVSAFCEATVQRAPFIARGNGGSGLVVLEPPAHMSEQNLLWYAAYLNRAARWRFSFGRMVTAERLSRIALPDAEHVVAAAAVSLIPPCKERSAGLTQIDLSSVPLTNLFILKSGDYHKAEDLPDGPFPLVSCGNEDNGIVRYCDAPKGRVYRNALTVAYNGSWPMMSKYHPYAFAAKDDVAVLLPRQRLTAPTLLFIQMMLTRETWRYSYGRKCFREKLSRMSIKLPVKRGSVDEETIARVFANTSYWEFISQTIRDADVAVPPSDQPSLL